MKLNKNIDYTTAVLTVAIALVGLLFIYSASSYSATLQFGDAYYYVKKQAISLAMGIGLMLVAAKLPLKYVKAAAPYALAVGLLLLGLVFTPLGVESYGATRWINLGIGTIQPSEIAKFCLIIFIAAYMSEYAPDTFPATMPVVLAGGAVCLLIMLEPNMSITICVAAVTAILLVVGGISLKHAAVYAVPTLTAGIALVFSEPYRIKRIMAFLDPWSSPKAEGYQLIQSYYALASGGLFGVGVGNSRQKYLFLPFAESDFILSIISEETGLIGCILLIALFLALILRSIKTAIRAKTRFGCYLSAGVAAMLAVQTVTNIAVVSGAIPPTGLPLPLVSAGGTSLIAYMCAIGLVMNVYGEGSNTHNFLMP